MTEEMIQQALDFRNSDLPDRTKVALELAEDFILNHANNVDDAFMDRLKEHFTEDQIVELTIGIGIWDSVHKFNNVFDVPPPWRTASSSSSVWPTPPRTCSTSSRTSTAKAIRWIAGSRARRKPREAPPRRLPTVPRCRGARPYRRAPRLRFARVSRRFCQAA